MARLKAVTQHDFLVTIAELQGYWSTFSGIEIESESETYNDGITKTNRTVLGAMEIANVTLEKPFDPVSDATLVERLMTLRYEAQDITVTVEPVRRTPQGPERNGQKSFTLYGCQIVKFMGFEVDTSSSDVSLLELELSVDDVAYN
ncbi:MAG TPA: hypothetical protein VKP88_07950 [Candidatus Paceibacterota bacterium]|nr:hypothetical protein [Candidatus Paceibacterota bacterium]